MPNINNTIAVPEVNLENEKSLNKKIFCCSLVGMYLDAEKPRMQTQRAENTIKNRHAIKDLINSGKAGRTTETYQFMDRIIPNFSTTQKFPDNLDADLISSFCQLLIASSDISDFSRLNKINENNAFNQNYFEKLIEIPAIDSLLTRLMQERFDDKSVLNAMVNVATRNRNNNELPNTSDRQTLTNRMTKIKEQYETFLKDLETMEM